MEIRGRFRSSVAVSGDRLLFLEIRGRSRCSVFVSGDPRSVLEEFGTHLDSDIAIQVWDSTSEMRYLVLPMRPQGTENWSEADLCGLVTRNSMIGVELAPQPGHSGK